MRVSQGALKTLEEREALRKVEMQKRWEGLEKAREAELLRRKETAEQHKQEEKELQELSAKVEGMRREYEKVVQKESELKSQKKKKNEETLKQLANQKEEMHPPLAQLEEELQRRQAVLTKAQKEEKIRQEEDDINWIKESERFRAFNNGDQMPAWSMLNKKRASLDAGGDRGSEIPSITNTLLSPEELEDIRLREQLAAAPKIKRKTVRFLLDPSWGEGSIARPGRSLVRLRKFKHLILAPDETEESRACVLVIFTDVCALCKPEANGLLRLLFRPAARALAWAELAPFDPAVIIMHFATLPPVYLRCSSPVEAHYWIYLFPRNETAIMP